MKIRLLKILKIFAIGCGETIYIGHIEYASCGKPWYNTVYFCDKCKNKIELALGIATGLIVGVLVSILVHTL